MIRGLYTAVNGLVTQEAKMDIITNNMANANTTGFKSDDLAIKKFGDVLLEKYNKMSDGSTQKQIIGSMSYGSRIDETDTIFNQGDIQDTGNDTDFALQGRGFFTVERDSGTSKQTYYTRDGSFHADSNGMLVTDNGDFVLDSNGNKINVGDNKFTSDVNGNITIDNNPNKIKLGVVDFNTSQSIKDAYKNMVKVGDNLYSTTDAPQTANAEVKQGSIEKSNVNVITEMVNMMNVMRTFESNQKVVQAMDETLGKTVNDVGSVK